MITDKCYRDTAVQLLGAIGNPDGVTWSDHTSTRRWRGGIVSTGVREWQSDMVADWCGDHDITWAYWTTGLGNWDMIVACVDTSKQH